MRVNDPSLLRPWRRSCGACVEGYVQLLHNMLLASHLLLSHTALHVPVRLVYIGSILMRFERGGTLLPLAVFFDLGT